MSKILLAEGQITRADLLAIVLVEGADSPSRRFIALATATIRRRPGQARRHGQRGDADHGGRGGTASRVRTDEP